MIATLPTPQAIVPKLLEPLVRLTQPAQIITAQDWESARRVRDLVDGIVHKAVSDSEKQRLPMNDVLWRASLCLRRLKMHHVETLNQSMLDVQIEEGVFRGCLREIETNLIDLAGKDPLLLIAVTHFQIHLADVLNPISMSPEAVIERDWGKIIETAAAAAQPAQFA